MILVVTDVQSAMWDATPNVRSINKSGQRMKLKLNKRKKRKRLMLIFGATNKTGIIDSKNIAGKLSQRFVMVEDWEGNKNKEIEFMDNYIVANMK